MIRSPQSTGHFPSGKCEKQIRVRFNLGDNKVNSCPYPGKLPRVWVDLKPKHSFYMLFRQYWNQIVDRIRHEIWKYTDLSSGS